MKIMEMRSRIIKNDKKNIKIKTQSNYDNNQINYQNDNDSKK